MLLTFWPPCSLLLLTTRTTTGTNKVSLHAAPPGYTITRSREAAEENTGHVAGRYCSSQIRVL